MTNKERYCLPAAKAPQVEIEPYEVTTWERWDGSVGKQKRPNRIYGARVVEGMLEVTAYTYDGIPLWRTWQDGDRVLGQTLSDPPKESRSTIGSRIQEQGGNWYTDAGSEAVIRDWLRDQFSPNLMGMISDSQTKIRHKKRDERWDRIRREIDNRMLEIRDVPGDVIRWVRNTVFRDSHYIIYRYRKGKDETDGFCTFCGHDVTVKAPRNRKPGMCPRCHRPITYLSEASLRRTNWVKAEKKVCYIQSTREGFCRREFHATLRMDHNGYKKLKPDLFERQRTFFSSSGGFQDSFYWGEFETSGQVRWCRGGGNEYGEGAVYPGNLKKLFADGKWKYVPMKEIAAHCQKIRFSRFPLQAAEPPVEHLAKHKLWNLTQEAINGTMQLPKDCRDIRKAMGGLDMPSIRMLAEMNATVQQLKLFRAMEAAGGKRPGKEELETAIRLDLTGRSHIVGKILEHTSIRKAEKYLLEQVDQYPERNEYSWEKRSYQDRKWTPGEVASEWADYLEDAEELGWQLRNDFVLFPKSLKQAHQNSTIAREALRKQKEIRKVNNILEKQKVLALRGKSWLIRPPVSGEEVLAEGQALRHCVGSYLNRIADGTSIIMLIRASEEPEKPAYTLELAPDTFRVRQVRGKCNSDPPKEVKDFVESWKRHLGRLGGPEILKQGKKKRKTSVKAG